jgi:predicted anti-sigma-YlaC factor YlaD
MMTDRPCEQLDGYLFGWLASPLREAFERHLAECVECRRAVREHAMLCSQLTQAVEQTQTVPPDLGQRVAGRIREESIRRRFLWLARGLAAAAVILFVFATWQGAGNRVAELAKPEPTLEVGDAKTEPPATTSAPHPNAPAKIRVLSRAIALPVETKNPSVSIFWIYPAIPGPTTAESELHPNNGKIKLRSKT